MSLQREPGVAVVHINAFLNVTLAEHAKQAQVWGSVLEGAQHSGRREHARESAVAPLLELAGD